MRVADYRNLISSLSDTFASLRSAATPKERVSEARRLIHEMNFLKRTECLKSKPHDRERLRSLCASITEYLDKTGLGLFCDALNQADINLMKMSFGSEYR